MALLLMYAPAFCEVRAMVCDGQFVATGPVVVLVTCVVQGTLGGGSSVAEALFRHITCQLMRQTSLSPKRAVELSSIYIREINILYFRGYVTVVFGIVYWILNSFRFEV